MTILTRNLLLSSVALAVLVSAFPSIANADTKEISAESEFARGKELYQDGEYERAALAFEEAYKLVADSVYLFNAAQAARKNRDCIKAKTHYAAYLVAEPAAENRAKVEQWIREMDNCAAIQVSAAEQSKALATALAAERAAQKTRHSLTRNVGGVWKGSGISVAVVGALAGGVSIFYARRSGSAADELAAVCAASCDWSSRDIIEKDALGRSYERTAILTGISSAALMAAGVGLYVFGMSRNETIVVGPKEGGGAMISAAGRF
jgi:hypothetical protein